jgi:hypothetical protein
MAGEEKKPRIDLKARLGKAQGVGVGVPAAAPAVPMAPMRTTSSVVPPSPTGSAPPLGSAPPPMPGFGAAAATGTPVGVPVPPFGSSRPAADPFGAAVGPAPMSRPAPATFKIELDEETMRAARKGGKRFGILGTIMLLLGAGVGFVAGSRYTDSKGAAIAVQGAQELVGDIDKSQGKIKDLADKIGAAVKDLKDRKFPESFGSDLGGLAIPFGADKLAGRNIGRFDGRTMQMLFKYTNDVEALNDRKDALRNLFSGQKKAIVDALATAQNPKVTYSVYIQRTPAHGPVAELAALNPGDAFVYRDANWPARFKIATGREFVDTERYAGGDVTSSDKKTVAIPVDPESVTSAMPNDILSRITSELAKTEGILLGSGNPGADDELGVLKKGEALLTALKKIGQKP